MQLSIDEDFAEWVIPASDSVRLAEQIVEELNLTPLYRAYKRRGRKPAADPSAMLKVILYAGMERIHSSRRIEAACKRDINFIWLLNGEAAPDRSQIDRFRRERLPECGEELSYELVMKLGELGEINFGHLFVDGTFINCKSNLQKADDPAPKNMQRYGGAVCALFVKSFYCFFSHVLISCVETKGEGKGMLKILLAKLNGHGRYYFHFPR